MARLYVGGLAGAVKPEEIAESFARAGAAVAGVELMRDADGRSKGFAYVEVADTEGAEKCIKLYNRTAWRGGRLRVEHASESYMARLQREWAERDGTVVVALAPSLPEGQGDESSGGGGGAQEEGEGGGEGGEGEGKKPKQERDKRYLRLRRKAGEKALVVDTLPVLLKARDAEKAAGKDGRGGKESKKRPRRRAAKLVDFSAGVPAGGEKSLKELWEGAFGPMEPLLALEAAGVGSNVQKQKKKRRTDEPEPEREEEGSEGDVAALLEAGEEGELDFAWGDEEERGGASSASAPSASSEGEEEGDGSLEEAEEDEASAAASEQEEEEEAEDEALAQQLREEEERNRRILSGILGGIKMDGAAGEAAGAGQMQPVATRRERAPQALVAVPRFDPTSEGAEALMMTAVDEEEQGEEEGKPGAAVVGGSAAVAPRDPSEAVAADVGALTDIYRTFRPGEGEEAVPLGAQDAVVPFSFGFGLGSGGGAPVAAASAATVAVAVPAVGGGGDGDKEGEDDGRAAADARAQSTAAAVVASKPVDWRSPEMVAVMWPALKELEARARAFVAGAGAGASSRRSASLARGEEQAAVVGGGGGGSGDGRQRQQRQGAGGPQRVDEGWRRERHNLTQDAKRKRRNALKINHKRK